MALGLVTKINTGLSEILSQQNKAHISDIVGKEQKIFVGMIEDGDIYVPKSKLKGLDKEGIWRKVLQLLI